MSTFRWDELSVDYGSAIGRVYNALHENGISLTHSEVHDAVFISFDELDFAFVYALLQPTDSRKWCLISAGAEAGEAIVGGGYAQHNITDNLPEAIGFVIKEIDRTRVYPTAVTVVVDTIEFFRTMGLLLALSPWYLMMCHRNSASAGRVSSVEYGISAKRSGFTRAYAICQGWNCCRRTGTTMATQIRSVKPSTRSRPICVWPFADRRKRHAA